MIYNYKSYPEVRVEKPNIYYAKLLLQDYAGRISEETAVNLYMYQNFLQSEKWVEFAKEIEKIAITEMHHLELLGKTIFKLGLKPIYAAVNFENDKIIYWRSEYVNYTDDIKKMLEVDIKSESLAIEQYRLHKNLIDDKYIKELLNRIIQDEKEHLRIFVELYNRI